MATISVTDDSFDSDVLKSSKPILVDFWAEWCGPCKMIGPVLEELSDEMSAQIIIAKHNICLLYTSPSPRDTEVSRMPSSA